MGTHFDKSKLVNMHWLSLAIDGKCGLTPCVMWRLSRPQGKPWGWPLRLYRAQRGVKRLFATDTGKASRP